MLVGSGGCAGWPREYGTHACCIDTKPAVRRQPISWHLFGVTVVSQIEQAFNVMRMGRRLFGAPVRALNLRGEEVADSAFLTNRDLERLSASDVRWGPTRPEDLGVPPFTITKPKTEGKTPGFFVTDSRGVTYLFKLDPVESPELLSGAEVVTSKLLYALGYHVPSYEVAFVRPSDLHVGSGAAVNDANGHARPFRDAELRQLLEGRVHEGTVRVCSTRILSGTIVGPARFKRFRDCAEMRALKIAYAWVNNIDTKDHNSLLVWDGTRTVGYLIDFGSSLGADAGLGGPKRPCEGWLNAVDLKEVSLKVLTLGLHHSHCDPEEQPFSPHVGLFSIHLDPDSWKPYAPNLAFEEVTEGDARWIARRIAQFSQAQLSAAVSAGQYHDPADATYLVDVLEQRRVAILEDYLE